MKRKQLNLREPVQANDEQAAQHDPEIEARVERAIAPYMAHLSPEDLGVMRETLRLYLASHPDVAPLIDRLRPRADAGSGGRPRAGLEPPIEQQPAELKAKPRSSR